MLEEVKMVVVALEGVWKSLGTFGVNVPDDVKPLVDEGFKVVNDILNKEYVAAVTDAAPVLEAIAGLLLNMASPEKADALKKVMVAKTVASWQAAQDMRSSPE